MKLTFKHSRSTTAVILALSLSACVRFDTRMQANGSFEYEDASLTKSYNTGDFTNDEARDIYDIPELTDEQKAIGFKTSDVDIRPPTQLMSVIDGVLLEPTEDGSTKIWFNAFNQDDDMQAKVWALLEKYLAENNVEIVERNESLQQIETGILSEEITFGSYFNKNTLIKNTSYKFTIQQQVDGHSVSLIVDALSYEEINDRKKLKLNLVASTKQDIEIRFVNSLLAYAYLEKESELIENGNTEPLSIKIGFDDNHQNTWISDDEFLDTWRKLPELFTLLNFEIIETDKNLGYYLLKYTKPSEEYWVENNLKPFDLEEGEYFVQLGEVTGGTTSVSWLDEDKTILDKQKSEQIYFSITDYLRDALIESQRQTKEF